MLREPLVRRHRRAVPGEAKAEQGLQTLVLKYSCCRFSDGSVESAVSGWDSDVWDRVKARGAQGSFVGMGCNKWAATELNREQ